MKIRFREIANIFLAFVIVFAFVYFIIFFIKNIVNLIISMSKVLSRIDTVIVVALLTGFLSIIGVIISKFFEYRQKRQMYLYEKKEKAYASFIEMVYKVHESIKKGEKYSDEDMLHDVLNFSKELTLWGSNKVIKKWIEFRNIQHITCNDNKDILYRLEDIMFEIRKDMGHKKIGLNKGDILAFFINDMTNDDKFTY